MNIENSCNKCWFASECGMKGSPMTYQQVALPETQGDDPETPFDCFFYVCEDGVAAATEVCENLMPDESFSFSTSDKPAHLTANSNGITGRFINGEQDIYVLQDGKPVYLRNIQVINGDLQRKQKLLRALREKR